MHLYRKNSCNDTEPIYHSMLLSKLGEFAVTLGTQALGLGDQSLLSWGTVTGLFDSLLQVLDLLRLEQLNQRVKLGKLLLNDSSGWRSAFGLEVVGGGNDSGNGLESAFASVPLTALTFFHFFKFFLAASLAFFAASFSALVNSGAFCSAALASASAAAFSCSAFFFSAGV